MRWNGYLFVLNYSAKAYLYLQAWVNYTTLNITFVLFCMIFVLFSTSGILSGGLSILLVLCPLAGMTQLIGGHLASYKFCHSQKLSCLLSVFKSHKCAIAAALDGSEPCTCFDSSHCQAGPSAWRSKIYDVC